MTILFIIAAIAFTIVMTAMMIRPFSMSQEAQISLELLDEDLREVETLAARKVSLVQSLRDIEYDFETHKISEEDYKRFKRSCERQALGVMRRLEAIHGSDRDWDNQIDEALEKHLQIEPQTGSKSPKSTADAPEPEQSNGVVEEISDEPQSACQSCGKALVADDLFCSRCGTAVQANPSEGGGTDNMESLDSGSHQREEITG